MEDVRRTEEIWKLMIVKKIKETEGNERKERKERISINQTIKHENE